jgi:hypothetical protein
MIRAWHFVGNTLRDGSPVPPDGVWLKHRGVLRMCESGLHASLQPFDALQYAPGSTLCLVDCGGHIYEGDDKLVCSRRRIVCRMDATEMLHYYTRMRALSVIHLWNAPDVVLDFLMTGDESLQDAAQVAAHAAERAMVWAAVQATAYAATHSPVWATAYAAHTAAHTAACAAVCAVACATAQTAAKGEFNTLVYECFDLCL